jgi:DNA-binding IclR family transcriptional regulator
MERALCVSEAVERLKGVFLEIPGTQLTVTDASRLAGLDPPFCLEIMAALEDARFLKRGRDGRYRYRASDSPSS